VHGVHTWEATAEDVEASHRLACELAGMVDDWYLRFEDVRARLSELMTMEEFGTKFKELDETRELAQAERDALTLREQRVENLEADCETLVKDMAEMVPEGLDSLTG
jgi:DNA repair ATPase RecN